MVVTSGGSERSSQLLKGVLDMCLLAIIDEEPSYGYEMVRKLSDRGLDLVSEGTIYPLLSRLQRQGLIEGYLVESSGGPARKYYRVAPEGATALEEWERDWRTLVEAVDRVLNGGSDD
ncbi:MAG: PadR family transcriptional regulator [Acidimicrobiia bacterium]|jgi:PadR family transcriptional regulator, regulatory protein PadR